MEIAKILGAAYIFLFFAGCADNLPRVDGEPGSSPRPEIPWTPPKAAIEKQKAFKASVLQSSKSSVIPQELLNNIHSLTLADIITIALLKNNQTREAWARARAAAAQYGSKRGAYLPNVNASASASRQKNPSLGAQFSSGAREYAANAGLNWLLFDFGGREASVEESREALFAADWTHNAVIQDVILNVEQAFYNYFAAKALQLAQQATVDEMQTNLNATNDRNLAGLATNADVLQARTALSQATLTLETLQGQVMTTRGVLATAMGLPANISYDATLPIGNPPLIATKKTIQEYLETALRERPDLAAAQAQALAAGAHVKSVRAQGYPAVSASGSIG
ncbi:MAG: TolC family protein, partial [Chitinivibrionales bacterium]|nr:TolC family protein [Chitinivibrionales bacterium]